MSLSSSSYWRLSFLCVAAVAWLVGCGERPKEAEKVTLVAGNGNQPSSKPQPEDVLRFAIAPVFSPEKALSDYWVFKVYLASKLKMPVELVHRKTYGETNELLRIGGAQAGMVCSGAYVRGKDRSGLELLAAPLTANGPVYYSYIIVRSDRGIEAFEQLQGKRFAFMDPLSNSGFLYPRYLLAMIGKSPDEFFSRHFFIHSHDNSMKAVADGLADGAAVDSLVYDQEIADEPAYASKLKVIQKSPPFAISPIVASPKTEASLRDRLRAVLTGMKDDPQAAAALSALGIRGFQDIDDGAYNSIREMLHVVEGRPENVSEKKTP